MSDVWLRREDLNDDAERQLWDWQRDKVASMEPLRIGSPDSESASSWGVGRLIRGHLIRQILLGYGPNTKPCIVRIEGARIVGSLRLEHANLVCPLDLTGCYFDEIINLEQTRAPAIFFKGCTIPNGVEADQIHTQNNFEIENCKVNGGIRLRAARIRGQFIMNSSRVRHESEVCLSALGMTALQGAFFKDFVAEGKVALTGATFGRVLDMQRAQLTKSPDGRALNARRITVAGAVKMSGGFVAEGGVDLTGSDIKGDANLAGGRFIRNGAAGPEERVIDLTRAFIGQNAYFNGGFHASGTVCLLDAQIKGSLRCEGGLFENPNDTAISAAGVTVERDVNLTKPSTDQAREDVRGFAADGLTDFSGARISGKMDCSGGTFNNPQRVALNISGITAGSLVFGKEFRASGTLDLHRARVIGVLKAGAAVQASQVQLKGLTYGSFEDEMPLRQRLEWLRSAQRPFEPQVYRQLASFYRTLGDDKSAKMVLVAGRGAHFSTKNKAIQALAWLFKKSVGYGYYPSLVLVWLSALEITGGCLFSTLRNDLLLAPIYIDSDASSPGHPLGTITGSGHVTEHGYPAYQPWLYTLDLLLPVVDLRQSEIWIPHRAAEWCSMAFIVSGWALATTLVIGLGSVFTREREESMISIPRG
ncbi:hypothetical protein ABIE67_005076 [Streptomyces sp. V4I8]|uniref:hypothetical protein n=1 Tax=Streptomyces sp. V4I8 TaxID=3156469 RepID=UPI003517C1A7